MNEHLSPWKRTLLDRPELFVLHYFPHKLTAYPGGKPELQEFHVRLIRTATVEPRGLILYPAAHGKTSLVSVMLPIWALCRNPNIRIAIIGKNKVEASSIMQAIHSELLGNDELIQDFGPFRSTDDDGKPWALEKLSIAARTSTAKEPTIAVMGSGSSTILGHRTDWCICDDVISEKNSSTPDQRHKIREWFNLKVETSPEYADSRITVVGTLFDPNDLYHDLRDMRAPDTGEPLWVTQREDAVVDAENHVTLWPDRWPWKRLMGQKAKMGTLDFNKRYRNIAVDKSRMVFKEEYVKGGWIGREQYPGCLDRNYRAGDFDETWRRCAGFDPAVGLSRMAKFCAHTVLAEGSCQEHDRCLWVVDLKRDQLTLPQQADQILDAHERFDLISSMVEANSYQGGLNQLLDERMEQRGKPVRIEPHYTTKTNKPDPEIGVQALSPWFEKGWVHIPWGDAYSRRVMEQLVDELIEYPGGRTTDCVMAFWFAWRALEISAPRYMATSYLKRPMVWSRHRPRKYVVNPYYVRS